MHGGLLCVTLCPSACLRKANFSELLMSSLKKYCIWSYEGQHIGRDIARWVHINIKFLHILAQMQWFWKWSKLSGTPYNCEYLSLSIPICWRDFYSILSCRGGPLDPRMALAQPLLMTVCAHEGFGHLSPRTCHCLGASSHSLSNMSIELERALSVLRCYCHKPD